MWLLSPAAAAGSDRAGGGVRRRPADGRARRIQSSVGRSAEGAAAAEGEEQEQHGQGEDEGQPGEGYSDVAAAARRG